MKKILNSRFSIFNSEEGFTLIELLVVIVIIGVLAGLIMSNFISTRQRARDGQRKSDLSQIQSSLEMYRADNQKYPDTIGNCGSGSSTYLGNDPTCDRYYLRNIPKDPSTKSPYQYNDKDNKYYCLRACFENGNDSDTDTNKGRSLSSDCVLSPSDCPGSSSFNYTLQSQ